MNSRTAHIKKIIEELDPEICTEEQIRGVYKLLEYERITGMSKFEYIIVAEILLGKMQHWIKLNPGR